MAMKVLTNKELNRFVLGQRLSIIINRSLYSSETNDGRYKTLSIILLQISSSPGIYINAHPKF